LARFLESTFALAGEAARIKVTAGDRAATAGFDARETARELREIPQKRAGAAKKG
jgi:hypothetical protein